MRFPIALVIALGSFAALAQGGDPIDAGDGADAGVAADAGSPLPPWPYPFTFRMDAAAMQARAEGKHQIRVLLNRAIAGAEKGELRLETATSRIEVWPHRHRDSAELLFVLEGSARVRGTDRKWIDLRPGDAAYAAPGVPHGFLWVGSPSQPTRVLLLRAPPGQEPADGVPVDKSELKRPDRKAPKPKVMRASDAPKLPIAGGAATVQILFDAANAGDPSAYVGVLRGTPALVVPEHVHPGEAELLFVTRGRGEMTVEGQIFPVDAGMAVHVPPGRRHAFRVTSTEPLEAIQFYAPSGPEQRFKPNR